MPEKKEAKIEEIEIKTLEQLQEVFDTYLLLADRDILKVMCATVISNQFKGYPNWLFLVAPSSGGKSELIQAFFGTKVNGQNLAFPISDLTVNAFASGQKKVGKETSLLHQIPPGGLLYFKDFTSMVSKAKESRTEIFKQLREIYDGSYIKRTGTGDNIHWDGKVGAVAGATQVIYEYQQEFATMGDRFIMYCMKQPDRKKLLDFILDDTRINADKGEMQKHLKDATSSFIEYTITHMHEDDVHLAQELKEDLKNVADFCTKVRSGVVVDERRPNIINFAPDHEMPVRMINQLLNLAKAFIIMRKTEAVLRGTVQDLDNVLPEEALVLYKVAFDSIPIKRRIALKALARYEGGVTTKGLATATNYQTPVIGSWLAQLNALGICTRQMKGGNQGDMWNLKDEYRQIMVKFEHIEVTSESLIDDSEDEEKMLDEGWDARRQDEREHDMASLEAKTLLDQQF